MVSLLRMGTVYSTKFNNGLLVILVSHEPKYRLTARDTCLGKSTEPVSPSDSQPTGRASFVSTSKPILRLAKEPLTGSSYPRTDCWRSGFNKSQPASQRLTNKGEKMTKIIEIDYCQDCKFVIQGVLGWRCSITTDPPDLQKLISGHYSPVIPSWCPLSDKEVKDDR